MPSLTPDGIARLAELEKAEKEGKLTPRGTEALNVLRSYRTSGSDIPFQNKSKLGKLMEIERSVNPINILPRAVEGLEKGRRGFENMVTEAAARGLHKLNPEATANPYIAATLGRATYVAPELALSMISKPQRFMGAAESMAQRHLGFSKPLLKTARGRALARGSSRLVVKEKLIPWSGSPEATFSRVEKLKSATGKAIGKMRDVGERSIEPVMKRLGKLRETQGIWTEGELASIGRKVESVMKSVKSVARKEGDIVLGKQGEKFVSDLKKLELAKKELADSVNWAADSVGKQKLVKKIVGNIESGVEDILTEVGSDLPKYRGLKKIYGSLEHASEALNPEIAAQAGNQMVGLKPVIFAASQALSHPAKAAATLGLTQLAFRRGAGTAAKILGDIAQARPSVVPMAQAQLVKASPKVAKIVKEKVKLSMEKAREILKRAKGDKKRRGK